ncbi:MAG TPA: ABC transporter substrate-binding protein [Actinomycetota bacterium]|nr:ABC transporter substrate-binding protein [Actinomycetota bacterium]
MAGRRLVRFSLAVSLALVGAACHREPAPTVQAPPNPTTAPSTVLAGCVVDQGSARPPSPRAGPSPGDYTIVQPGILVAASVTSRPPFESLQGGHPVGFDIDLIAEVSRRLGLRPEIQSATPSSVLTDVAQRRADVAISALSIRADRRSLVDFTDAYYAADLALTVGVGQARGFGLSALAGRVLGVPGGTTAESCARSTLLPQARLASIKPYQDVSAAFTDLSVGRLGAVVADVPTSDRLVQAVPGLQMVQIYRTGDAYAIAIARSNPKLRDVINRVLGDMRRDGTYALLFQKWFQVQPPSG